MIFKIINNKIKLDLEFKKKNIYTFVVNVLSPCLRSGAICNGLNRLANILFLLKSPNFKTEKRFQPTFYLN